MNIKRTDASFYGLVLLLVILPGCFPDWFSSQKETQVEAQKEGLIVVDVNSQKQYDDCHIRGAVHVAIDQLEPFAATLDKEKTDIIFYCSNYMCTASGAAALKFKKLGFKSVAAYEGGIAEWYQQGLPVDGPAQESYLKLVMNKPAHEEQELPVIEIHELAQKMGIAQ